MRDELVREIDVSKLSSLKQFSSFFKSGVIEQLARESGLISRSTSRLSGEAFLKMLTTHVASPETWSLTDQCQYLQDQFGITLTKQSLDERYHTFAVRFLKSCYQFILQQSLQNETTGLTASFDNIYLTDATSFQLPAHLAAFYQSNGGDTSGASIKIQHTLELLRFQIADIQLTDGKQNDNTYTYWQQKGFELEQNSLWIADLGYVSWDTLAAIATAGSYFLCRYKTATLLYSKQADGSYEPLDMENYLQQYDTVYDTVQAQNQIVYFGENKIRCRFISQPVPQQIKQQRLAKYRKAHANQSKQGRRWEMTALKEKLCGYNLYLTNAPQAKLPTKEVFSIYGLRWQMELVFKRWKSLLYIDQVAPMSIFRFECYLYGRLIFILLSTELMAFIKNYIEEQELEIEISEWKTMKLIKKNCMALQPATKKEQTPLKKRSANYLKAF